MSLTKIGSIGINTGIAFAGVTTIVTLNTANDALSIGATVNVGSGITLGASGDIFATGVSTVTTLKVGSGVTVSSDGDVFATGVTTSTTFSGAFSGSGANITAINASNIASGTVPTARLGSGTASSSTFLRGDSSFQTVNTDLVSDTSPQLGGNLDTNSFEITLDDDHSLNFGDSSEFKINYSSGGIGLIDFNGSSNLQIKIPANEYFQVQNRSTGDNIIEAQSGGALSLYNAGSKKFETTSSGVTVTGNFFPEADNTRNIGDGTTNFNSIWASTRFRGNDNVKLILGDAQDLQIYHDGSHSYISEQGTGNLRVLTNAFTVNNAGNSENMMHMSADGAVELYHDGVKKFETYSGGAYVTGVLKGTTTGFGIDFGSTSNGGGMSSEVLDDYEEGTWTPTYLFGGSDTATYTNRSGYYTKIGDFVFAKFAIDISSRGGSGSGRWDIGGLPFNIADKLSTTGQEVGGMLTYWNNTAPFNLLTYWGQNGNNYLQMQYTDGDGRAEIGQYVNRGNLNDNTGVRGYVMYHA